MIHFLQICIVMLLFLYLYPSEPFVFRFEELRGLFIFRVQNTVLQHHVCHIPEWCVVTSEWHKEGSKHMLETYSCHCNVKNFSCHISHLFVFYFSLVCPLFYSDFVLLSFYFIGNSFNFFLFNSPRSSCSFLTKLQSYSLIAELILLA